MMSSPRIAFIGYGWAARMHARAATALGLPISGVVGPNTQKRDAFASEFSASASSDDLAEVLSNQRPNLVVIASPNADHFEQASECIRAGVHLLVEKPVTTKLVDALALARLAKDHEVTVSVGHMWRYHDDVIALRDRVSSGELGPIVRTHGYGVHARFGPSGWFTQKARAGGGALIDMGIHAIDTARFILGDPLPMRVQASIGVGSFRDDIEVDDDGLVIVDWNNGVRSLVEFGWWESRLEGLEAETEVVGREGVAQIWPNFRSFSSEYVHCSLEMYQRQLADVAQSSCAGVPSRVSLDVGITALQVVVEAYEAATLQYQPTKAIKTWEPLWRE